MFLMNLLTDGWISCMMDIFLLDAQIIILLNITIRRPFGLILCNIFIVLTYVASPQTR